MLNAVKEMLIAVRKALDGLDLAKKFPEQRYEEGGPSKYEQENERIPTSVMSMYNGWTSQVIYETGLDESVQIRRFVAERIYAVTGYGMMGVRQDHWDVFYPNTLPESVVAGLASFDPKTIKTLIDEIKPKLLLLLEAGVKIEDVVDAIREIPVESVQTS